MGNSKCACSNFCFKRCLVIHMVVIKKHTLQKQTIKFIVSYQVYYFRIQHSNSFNMVHAALFGNSFKNLESKIWFLCSITVLVMWGDRKVSSTAFLLINLAITDTLTLLGFWLIQTLLTIDKNFDVNIGE